MTIGIFAAGMALIPSSLDDPMNIFQKIIVVLTLAIGAPGSIAYMFTGGVHVSTLSRRETLILVAVVSALFWATVTPFIPIPRRLPRRRRRHVIGERQTRI